MMAVELKAPRFVGGQLAEQADPVKIFAELERQAGHLGERLVQPHGVARRLVGVSAERGAQDGVGQFALRFAQFDQTQPMPHQIAMDVAPGAPDFAVDGEGDVLALRRVERRHKRGDRVGQRLHAGAGLAQRKQAGLDRPVSGQSDEGLGQRDIPAGEQILQRLRHRIDVNARRRAKRTGKGVSLIRHGGKFLTLPGGG